MSFKFRLQKVLDLKEQQEEDKKNKMAVVIKQISVKEDEIKIKTEEREEKVRLREEKNTCGTTIQELLSLNKYITYLEETLNKLNYELIELQKQLKICQDDYMEARKERKSFENLKEKDFEKYKEKEAKEEEKMIDQIVSFANRKQ